jgi:hypothetical protein
MPVCVHLHRWVVALLKLLGMWLSWASRVVPLDMHQLSGSYFGGQNPWLMSVGKGRVATLGPRRQRDPGIKRCEALLMRDTEAVPKCQAPGPSGRGPSYSKVLLSLNLQHGDPTTYRDYRTHKVNCSAISTLVKSILDLGFKHPVWRMMQRSWKGARGRWQYCDSVAKQDCILYLEEGKRLNN